MEDYVKRLEGVYRNIQTGGYFEEEGTIDGGEKGSYNPTIPEGFRPVDTKDSQWGDGTTAPEKTDVNNGLVIEDKDGNQFVWVPCYVDGGVSAETEGLTKYAKHEYKEESDKWLEYQYQAYDDWTDPAVPPDTGYGKTSVNKYGGFYVARYEAGIPETANFYPKEENGYQYIQPGRDTGDIAPVSKKNTPSWSWISQTSAINASEKMVNGKSHLIDGTAWDTIVEWIGDTAKTVTDSKDVGNYYTSTGEIPTGAMYIKHTFENNERTTGDSYQQATETITQPGGKGNDRYEVYTGSLDNTKLKNIYDMAGNMWEWTTETGKHGNESDSTFAVLRGGAFGSSGAGDSLCDRSGDQQVTATSYRFGFRVVLYL